MGHIARREAKLASEMLTMCCSSQLKIFCPSHKDGNTATFWKPKLQRGKQLHGHYMI